VVVDHRLDRRPVGIFADFSKKLKVVKMSEFGLERLCGKIFMVEDNVLPGGVKLVQDYCERRGDVFGVRF